jgi:uncharacterized protein (TIGR03435 family)
MRAAARALSFISAWVAASGQTPDARLTFEVASVRVSAPQSYPPAPSQMPVMRGGPGTEDSDQITYKRIPIITILLRTFDVKFDQLIGPGWISDISQKYDIQAKVPPSTTKEQANIMMLNLLKERLGMTFHRETKEFTVYELTVAKGGPKLKQAEPANGEPTPRPQPSGPGRGLARDRDGFPELPPGRLGLAAVPNNGRTMMSARMMTAEGIASSLGNRLGTALVIDKTGLAGSYDFKLTFAGPSPLGGRGAANPDAGPIDDASEPASVRSKSSSG